MVLLNYEKQIEEHLLKQSNTYKDPTLSNTCADPDFRKFMIKLYEYCEEINIIEQRMDILAKETAHLKGLKPKLLDSEIIKIQEKTKQISSYYSVFLFKQPKIKVASEERSHFELIIKLITIILEEIFRKKNQKFDRLRKQINRLLRTNTFNKRVCWDEFVEETNKNPKVSVKKKKMVETNFRGFRRMISNQKSQIRPYVNNRSSFRTKLTRSPMISLLFPTNEYLSFKLARRNMKSMSK